MSVWQVTVRTDQSAPIELHHVHPQHQQHGHHHHYHHHQHQHIHLHHPLIMITILTTRASTHIEACLHLGEQQLEVPSKGVGGIAISGAF